MIDGVDLYQGNPFGPASGADFVFLKATEGHTLRDAQFAARWVQLAAMGKVRGAYHFPSYANSAAADFAHFAAVVGPVLRPGDLIALDYESDGSAATPASTTGWKNTFLGLAKGRWPNNRVGLYCNLTWWHGTDNTCGDFLWIADYGTRGAPAVVHPWTFQQYSTSGGVDHDAANFADLAELRAWAAGPAAPTPPPAPAAPTTPGGDQVMATAQDVANAVVMWQTTVPALGGQEMSIGTAVYTAAACSAKALEAVQELQAKLTAAPAPPAVVDAAAVAAALAGNPQFVAALADAVVATEGRKLST